MNKVSKESQEPKVPEALKGEPAQQVMRAALEYLAGQVAHREQRVQQVQQEIEVLQARKGALAREVCVVKRAQQGLVEFLAGLRDMQRLPILTEATKPPKP